MVNTVRAKFQVQEITEHSWHPTGRTIVLRPMYDTNIPEDQRFAQFTPSGEFKMFVDNPAVIETLKKGQFFYIDLTPVEQAQNG